jgi:ribosomal protein S1
LFIGFDSGVDGLVHVSDISEQGLTEEAQKKYKAGDKIKVIVLGSNYEKERISLGIRQIDNPNFQAELDKITENSVVSCLVIAVKKDFLEVELDSGLKAIIKRLDLSNNKQNQKTEKYEVNERIEAKVTMFNKISGKLLLSIKELETDLSVDLGTSAVEAAIAMSNENVNGYPTPWNTVYNKADKEVDETLPIFTKTEKSKSYHSAGYYGIKFPNGWTQSFCPRVHTLTSYE